MPNGKRVKYLFLFCRFFLLFTRIPLKTNSVDILEMYVIVTHKYHVSTISNDFVVVAVFFILSFGCSVCSTQKCMSSQCFHSDTFVWNQFVLGSCDWNLKFRNNWNDKDNNTSFGLQMRHNNFVAVFMLSDLLFFCSCSFWKLKTGQMIIVQLMRAYYWMLNIYAYIFFLLKTNEIWERKKGIQINMC